MGLTGQKLRGKDLAKCGVATHFVPQDKLDSLKHAIIEKVDENTDVDSLNEIVKHYAEIVYSPDIFSFPNYDEIKRTFAVDSLDDLYKRLDVMTQDGSDEEKKWATNILKTLNRASPISLAVTLEQVKRGITLKSIEEAFNIEAQIVSGYVIF